MPIILCRHLFPILDNDAEAKHTAASQLCVNMTAEVDLYERQEAIASLAPVHSMPVAAAATAPVLVIGSLHKHEPKRRLAWPKVS